MSGLAAGGSRPVEVGQREHLPIPIRIRVQRGDGDAGILSCFLVVVERDDLICCGRKWVAPGERDRRGEARRVKECVRDSRRGGASGRGERRRGPGGKER